MNGKKDKIVIHLLELKRTETINTAINVDDDVK